MHEIMMFGGGFRISISFEPNLLTVATRPLETLRLWKIKTRARQQKALGTLAQFMTYSHSRVFCAGKISDSFYRSSIGRCSINQNGNEYTTF